MAQSASMMTRKLTDQLAVNNRKGPTPNTGTCEDQHPRLSSDLHRILSHKCAFSLSFPSLSFLLSLTDTQI